MSESILIAIIGITVILAEGLIGIMKSLITKFTEKDKKYLTDDEHQMLARLDELHSRYDSDGTPLWYVPRSWAETQKEIAETQREVVSKLHNITVIIDRLEKRLS